MSAAINQKNIAINYFLYVSGFYILIKSLNTYINAIATYIPFFEYIENIEWYNAFAAISCLLVPYLVYLIFGIGYAYITVRKQSLILKYIMVKGDAGSDATVAKSAALLFILTFIVYYSMSLFLSGLSCLFLNFQFICDIDKYELLKGAANEFTIYVVTGRLIVLLVSCYLFVRLKKAVQ